jgi:regulator of sigma E protease
MGFGFFFHELGHYIAYRMVGVMPRVFAIGMGPQLLAYTDSRKTTWQLCLLPIGAYVEAAPVRLGRLSEIFVAIAGPLANVVTGVMLMSGLFLWSGCSVVRHNGQDYVCLEPVAAIVGADAVRRVGVAYTLPATTILEECKSPVVTKDGCVEVYTRSARCGVIDALCISFKYFVRQAAGLSALMAKLKNGVSEATEGLSGPIGIMRIAAAADTVIYALFIATHIAFGLGVFNMLPIPPLDGSRIVCALLGIDLTKENKGMDILFIAGILCVGGLMIFMSYKDILKVCGL